MITVSIVSMALGNLRVDVDMGKDGPINAYFTSSGNELPHSMWMRLINSTHDISTAYEEVEKEHA